MSIVAAIVTQSDMAKPVGQATLACAATQSAGPIAPNASTA